MSAVTLPDGHCSREALDARGALDFVGVVAPEFVTGAAPGFTDADGDGDTDGRGVSLAMNSEMGSSDGNGVGAAPRDPAHDAPTNATPNAATSRRILAAA